MRLSYDVRDIRPVCRPATGSSPNLQSILALLAVVVAIVMMVVLGVAVARSVGGATDPGAKIDAQPSGAAAAS